MRVRKRRLLDMLRSYRAAAAALPDAVVVLDRNSQRVQWFNEAATALLGLHHPGDLGEALVERLQPMPLAHWLAGGRNAEPILDVPSPVDPAIRLNLRLIPYSSDYWLLIAATSASCCAWNRCAATSWPMFHTSCARRSPWSTATWT